MKVTLLGTGGSAGVPMIGGPDGGGELGRLRSRRTEEPPHAVLDRCGNVR